MRDKKWDMWRKNGKWRWRRKHEIWKSKIYGGLKCQWKCHQMKEHLSFPREVHGSSRKNDGGKFKFEQETMEIFKKYVCLKMAKNGQILN